jgi:WD40 repeat protein
MSDTSDLPAAEQNFPAPGLLPQVARVFGDLRFHTDGDLLALAFTSPEILWSVEEPGVLRQWNVTTGQPLGSAFLSDLETLWVFSGDGRVLVSASDEVSLWDPATGQLRLTLPQPSWVTAVAMRAQPAQVATGHDDGVVRIWDPATNRLVHELAGHDQPIGALAYSQDGARLASAGEDRLIRIWETGSGRLLGTLSRHTDRIGGLLWHPQGRILISAAWDRTARLWDTTTFEPIILLNTHADQVTALALSPDGSVLACADSANTIHLWDPDAAKELHVLPEHQNEIRCLAFSADGQRLASGGTDWIIHLWDPRQGRLLSGHGQPALQRTHLAVVNQGKGLASTCGGVCLRVWDIASGHTSGQPAGAPQPEVLTGSPDGRWLAGGQDKQILLWDAVTGELNAVLEGQAGKVAALAFAPDSTTLASASATDGTVWLWNVQTREPVLVIPMAADGCTVETLAFHPRGHLLAAGGIDWLATGGSDGAVSIWDVPQRQLLATFNRGATGIAFHPAGRWLAAALLNDSLGVWDLQTGQLAFAATGHTDTVTCVAYSPDGAWLVSGSDDRTIRFWNASTGELAVVQTLDTPIKALTFSPDGRSLFTGNGNTTSYAISLKEDSLPSELAYSTEPVAG